MQILSSLFSGLLRITYKFDAVSIFLGTLIERKMYHVCQKLCWQQIHSRPSQAKYYVETLQDTMPQSLCKQIWYLELGKLLFHFNLPIILLHLMQFVLSAPPSHSANVLLEALNRAHIVLQQQRTLLMLDSRGNQESSSPFTI